VSGTIRWLASRWSNCTDYRFELVTAGVSGNLAYVVGFEHIANSVNDVPVEPYTLRVTHIFRRETVSGRLLTVMRTTSRSTRQRSARSEAGCTCGPRGTYRQMVDCLASGLVVVGFVGWV